MFANGLHGGAGVVHGQLNVSNVPRTQSANVVHQLQALVDILVVCRPNGAIHRTQNIPVQSGLNVLERLKHVALERNLQCTQ